MLGLMTLNTYLCSTGRTISYRYKDGNDDNSVFSTTRVFVTVIEIFIPVHQLQLNNRINMPSLRSYANSAQTYMLTV